MGVISIDFRRSYFEIIIDNTNENYRYASPPFQGLKGYAAEYPILNKLKYTSFGKKLPLKN